MKGEVEHANINVADLDETVAFLMTALPHFKVRHRGTYLDGVPWLHIGTDATYLALNQPPGEIAQESSRFNHIGFVVEDAIAVRRRCLEAGYQDQEGFISPPHPHRKRIYILDREGLEWEFVEYLSDEVEKRNDYSDS